MERLQKIISNAGITSRRKAEELIKDGRVKVNGEVITEMGYKVSSKDRVEVDSKLIEKEEKVYFLLNKPRGYITSTNDDKNRKTVLDLIDTDKRIYPVGRLDYDTTGVLLLTNDGEFYNILTHPKNNIEKVYIAKIEGIIDGESINKIKKGIVIDNKKIIPGRVKLRKVNKEKNTSIVEISVHEGMNHLIKKIFMDVSFPVIKLNRKRVGIFTVDDLPVGKYRRLTPKEVQIIYSQKK